MSRLRPLLLFGTRPEAIKMAPVVQECRQRSGEFDAVVCSTGQHRELLGPVIEYFRIEPDEKLDLMVPKQPLA